jgi:putative transposase
MIAFIDKMKDRFGVELVCRTMRAAEVGFLSSRGYRVAKSRPASARNLSDQLLSAEIARLHAENYGVYGVRKMHRLLKRQGWTIGRDQTGRLMRSQGLRGVQRSKRVFTTKSDPAGRRPTDLVQRYFRADAPRKLWVVDVTYVRTWQGFAYVAFVTDVFSRRIVGWNVAATLKADILPLQALDMAAFDAGGDLTGLTHHSDHGSNYMALVYTDRIVELGAVPSTGTVGDSLLTGYSDPDPLGRHAALVHVHSSSESPVQHVVHDGEGSPAVGEARRRMGARWRPGGPVQAGRRVSRASAGPELLTGDGAVVWV